MLTQQATVEEDRSSPYRRPVLPRAAEQDRDIGRHLESY